MTNNEIKCPNCDETMNIGDVCPACGYSDIPVEHKKPKFENECDALSAKIIELQDKDIKEYQDGVKNKSYHLSRFLKTELIVRSAQNGCSKASFKLNRRATQALCGCAFLVEDGTVQFTIKALDRNTFLITFKAYSEKMSNAQIHYFNASYELNIPLNEEVEIYTDEDQINDNQYIKSAIRIKKG